MYRNINLTGVSCTEYARLTRRRNEQVFMRRNDIKHKEFKFPSMTANLTIEKVDACAVTIARANALHSGKEAKKQRRPRAECFYYFT